MHIIDYGWLIPAMPALAFLIIVFVTRPLSLRARPRSQAVAAVVGAPVPDHGHGGASVATLDRDQAVEGNVAAYPPGVIQTAEGQSKEKGEYPGDAHEAEHEAHGSPHGGHGEKIRMDVWDYASGWVGVVTMLIAFILSVAILFELASDTTLLREGRNFLSYSWFGLGSILDFGDYRIGFRIDGLTSVMLVVVTGVSLLVQIYSQGYMTDIANRRLGDSGYPRFFAWLSLFTLSMLLLILADNFLLLYIGWELVGLCSYLLVGYWYEQAAPAAAAKKAFITTRLGDLGLLIGILILFFQFKTFNFNTIIANAHTINPGVLTAAMILVFAGAVGKSAQFPLHVWLPDAMEGPTPVSALIHAATMVAAGVYLVARTFTLFQTVPAAAAVVAGIGGFTAIFAATIALVQPDIKRVLAYSTISQLGYMMLGLGVSSLVPDGNAGAGSFHLFTHAFFKALLFLGSGSVIHFIENQDMRRMGGLAPFIKPTAICFLLATLSISGIPPFSGYFSKDGIIGTAFTVAEKTGNPWIYLLGVLSLITAFLTAFYMFRIIFLTFGGKGGKFGGLWGGEYRGDRGDLSLLPKPNFWLMDMPLILLSIPTIIAGFWNVSGGFTRFILNNKPIGPEHEQLILGIPTLTPVSLISILAGLAGIALAWAMYGLCIPAFNPDALAKRFRPIYTLLLNKYYMDELYQWLINIFILGFAKADEWFDQKVIDGAVNGTGTIVLDLGNDIRHLETGRVQNYAMIIFAGIVVLAVFLLFLPGTR